VKNQPARKKEGGVKYKKGEEVSHGDPVGSGDEKKPA